MKAIGIVLAGGNSKRMRELSNKRAISAMPVAGSYRSIDFALSNMSNSHIQNVAVFTQYNSRSLNEHLSSSKWWDFGRKQGGLYVFTPTITAENSDWYRGTADALYQNLPFLKNSHEPYVVIAAGDGIYKLDYNKVLEYHIEKKADITITGWKTVEINGIEFELNSILVEKWKGKPYRLVIQRQRRIDGDLDIWEGEYTYRCILTNDYKSSARDIVEFYNLRGGKGESSGLAQPDQESSGYLPAFADGRQSGRGSYLPDRRESFAHPYRCSLSRYR